MISWGVIGTGWIAKQFATDMKQVEDGEITAITARDQKSTQGFADQHAIPKVHNGIDELLNDPSIDIVYVATPHSSHAELMIRALEANKHVLCEKPFTMNAEEAMTVADLAKSKSLFVMEGMWTRFLPSMVKLRELLSHEVIGKLEFLELSMGCRFEKGRFDRMFDPKLGGGCLLDMGVYCASFSQMLSKGQPEIMSTIKTGETGVDLKTSWVEDHFGGLRVTASSSMASSLSNTAVLSGADGKISIPEFWRAKEFTLDQDTMRFDFEGMGLQFEIKEVHRCLRREVTESQIMPLSDTIEAMERLDRIRECSNVKEEEKDEPSSSF